MGEAKFKVGDKVRRINNDNSSDFRVGDTGVVVEVKGDGDVMVKTDRTGETMFNMSLYLELVPALFNVGDRVTGVSRGKDHISGRIIRVDAADASLTYRIKSDHDNERYWLQTPTVAAAAAPKPAPFKIEVGKTYRASDGRKIGPMNAWTLGSMIAKVGDGNVWLLDGKPGLSNVDKVDLVAEWIEPAPAPFKIEVGKFYRTRDGRKAGPVTTNGHGVYGADGFGAARWYDTGRSYTGSYTLPTDLVEEWNGLTVPAQTAPKFKVGDRVRMVNEVDGCKADCGATVSYIGSGIPHPILLKLDDPAIWAHSGSGRVPTGLGYWVDHADIELITEPAQPKAIVALIENGQPKPSERPHVHATEASAITEAARLAGVHKGQQFGVYVLTNTQLQPKPVYDHEWQRQAANGNKIPAIKAFRELTGLGLKGAKDAVEGWLASEAA